MRLVHSARVQADQGNVRVRSRGRQILGMAPLYAALWIWTLLVIFPLLWLVYSSFKSNAEINASVWGLPIHASWDNFVRAWRKGSLGWALLNSLFYGLGSVAIADLFAAMAAYVLSRLPFRGSNWAYTYFLAGVFVPTSLTVIPTSYLLRDIHLMNTHLGLLLVYTAWNIPFAVFVLCGFFKSIPRDLLDAALIDGTSEFGTFWRIVLPLGRSGIVAVSILNFLWVWNELLYALVLVTDARLRPLALALQNLKAGTYLSGDWAVVFAGATLAAVPLIIVYVLLQRQIVEGATMGALKG